MEIQTLQGIGTMISVLAVLLSMGSLAYQVRRNTQVLRIQNYVHALDRLAAIQSRMSANQEMASLFARGVRNISHLNAEERIQFTWAFYEMFGAFEFMFDQAKLGNLPANVWDRWKATISWWLSLPGVADWWRGKPAPFSTSFSEFIESCLKNPAYDQTAALRWQEFLQGKGLQTGDELQGA